MNGIKVCVITDPVVEERKLSFELNKIHICAKKPLKLHEKLFFFLF